MRRFSFADTRDHPIKNDRKTSKVWPAKCVSAEVDKWQGIPLVSGKKSAEFGKVVLRGIFFCSVQQFFFGGFLRFSGVLIMH